MKIKNKGKVYPSPSSSSSSSSCSNAAAAAAGGGGGDYLSVLKLLPVAIIALVSVLPLDDREVLAYLIMRSIKTTTTTTSPPSFSQKKPTKKTPNRTSSGGGGGGLYCDCFDCYTSFWFRWDSSPNRELIHQAIEAFEDHLTSGETEKSKKNAKAKRRDKTARRFVTNDNQSIDVPVPGRPESLKQVEMTEEESSGSNAGVVLPENEVTPVGSPEKNVSSAETKEVADVFNGSPHHAAEEEVVRTTAGAAITTHHKGLARKVLPDVLGLLNSRLWSLWSPNV